MQLNSLSLLATLESSLDQEVIGADFRAILEKDKLKMNFLREEFMKSKNLILKLSFQELIARELLLLSELRMLHLLKNLTD